MAPHLLAAGAVLDVVHFGDHPGLTEELEASGATVCAIHGRARRIARTHALRSLMRERRPDLVHTTLFEADVAGRIAARSLGIPIVSSIVSTPYGASHRVATHIPRWKLETARLLDAGTARMVDRFHAISAIAADEMARRLRIPRDRIEVVPRGREPKALGRRTPQRRAAVRKRLGISEDAVVLLTAARHDPPKGLDVAVRAMPLLLRSVPGAVLLMAGKEGSATRVVRSTIESSGATAHVRLLGPRDDVGDLLVAADLFLSPSRWEGFGSVLLEAMALESRIVASDLPVLREVLTDDGDEVAWFSRPDDPEDLARQCLQALGEADTDRPVAARDRFVRCYTADRAAAGVLEIYRQVLT
jgi:glycosyltransferase involved in cell wall biosynthesis